MQLAILLTAVSSFVSMGVAQDANATAAIAQALSTVLPSCAVRYMITWLIEHPAKADSAMALR